MRLPDEEIRAVAREVAALQEGESGGGSQGRAMTRRARAAATAGEMRGTSPLVG